MFSSHDTQLALRSHRGSASNRKGLGIVSLASLAAFLLVGCQTPQAQEQGQTPPETPTTPTKAETTPAKTDTTPAAPAKTYKVVTPSADDFGPQAPKNFVDGYIKAMKEVAVDPPADSFKLPEHPRVQLTTSKGKITLELNPQSAPLNAKSFYYLSGKGFYDGTIFHRFADLTGDGKGGIIQGGDPLTISPATRLYKGLGGPGYNVPLEISKLKHDKLVIAAARSNDPDSAGSQFYITQGDPHFLDGQYTVFGKVVEGGDVALKLAQDDKLISAKVLESKGN